MNNIKLYHRPQTVEEALQLLPDAEGNKAILAGGTTLIPHMDDRIEEVIDLQNAGLDKLEHTAGQMSIGAMVRLQTIVDDPHAPTLLREAARREGPNTFRHAATFGGTVVNAHWESELLAALLALQTEVHILLPPPHPLAAGDGAQTFSLPDFLTHPVKNLNNGLLTCLTLHTGGQTAAARVARTPADAPIVAAVGRKDAAGTIHLALSGVAERPVLVNPNELDSLTPPSDFRGSSDYRAQMAQVLSARVLNELQG